MSNWYMITLDWLTKVNYSHYIEQENIMNALEYIDLAETKGLPLPTDREPKAFFDWEDEQKDILLKAFLQHSDPVARHDYCADMTDHVDLMFTNPKVFIQKCKNAIYSEIEDQLIEIVDECLGLGDDNDEGGAFRRGE